MQRTSDVHAKTNALVSDVLRALDALKAHISGEQLRDIAHMFEHARLNPDPIADSCKTRLQELGEK